MFVGIHFEEVPDGQAIKSDACWEQLDRMYYALKKHIPF